MPGMLRGMARLDSRADVVSATRPVAGVRMGARHQRRMRRRGIVIHGHKAVRERTQAAPSRNQEKQQQERPGTECQRATAHSV